MNFHDKSMQSCNMRKTRSVMNEIPFVESKLMEQMLKPKLNSFKYQDNESSDCN